MKTIYKITVWGVFIVSLFTSCKGDLYDKSYTISSPEISSANITPATFTFGDTITLTATLSDPETPLATLDINIIANNQSIFSQTVQVGGNSNEINLQIPVPLVNNLSDNADVKVILTLKNTLKGEIGQEIDGLTGKRPYFAQLYLVEDNGTVYTLTPKSGNKDQYDAGSIVLPKSFSYRIAQKITPDNQIDYSGMVWGNNNGQIRLVNETGSSAFAYVNGDYTTGFVFDDFAFTVALNGANYMPGDLLFDNFENPVTINGEDFNKLSVSLQNGQILTVFPIDAVYNVDFFERTGANTVKFLGETGSYDLYYSAMRKIVIAGVANPAYPDYLLMAGQGIGYPAKVSGITIEHTGWGFDNVMEYILFRKIADNVFQGTVMIHSLVDAWAFKPFKNTGWGGEIQANTVTFTGEPVLGGDNTNNNWQPTGNLDPAQAYRITIDLNNNTVNTVKYTLP